MELALLLRQLSRRVVINMADHPAEKDFDSIRGKPPAHYDHKRVVNDSNYHRGGGTGFNLHEGVAGQVSQDSGRVVVRPHERALPARPLPQMPTDALPSMPMPPMTGDSPSTFAGVDLQVPPVRKY